MSNFYILNGPPGVGKDTIAQFVVEHDKTFRQLEFKDGLYQATAELFKVDYTWFRRVAVDRILKETQMEVLKDKTPREAMIETSEAHIKPNFGKEYFGQMLLETAARWSVYNNFIVSDGGFVEEASVLVNAGHNVTIVQLYCPGFTFDKDSRDYVLVPGAHHRRIDVMMGDVEHGYLAFLDILNNPPQEFLH